MTTVIDERVVEMRFNNADFEKNVAQSMSTLDKLKKALNFDSAKSLEEIGKASSKFKMSGLVETIKEATNQFSVMEIAGVAAIMNITNRAVDFSVKFAKSLSIDQVTSGFDKYAVKTQSVQTIMAATADKFKNQAEQMEYVNSQLEKLTWFTDETSYSMTDMTNNIGKFVSNNIPLEESVTAMEGIATWAGLSGANVQEASRAMYNFSQAMGAGAMKLQDWKSIENANMATSKFKKTALETAVELGKLKKVGDDLYTTMDGKVSASTSNFSESLKSKWFDTEVMTATLKKFGGFADELYKLSDATGLTASELLESLDEYKAGTLDLSEIARGCEISVSDLDAKFKELTGDGFELGKKAFAAAQEAKTFTEAIDSAKDAVSSGWMTTFELIFGNYLEAKKLWTGLANTLYDMFAEGGNKRNEVLKVWKELGGRNSLIMGAVEACNLLIKPLSTIKHAFESVLPKGKDFGKVLNQLTYKFYIFMSRLQPSEKSLENLYQFFKGIFSVGKLVLTFFGNLIKAVANITKPFRGIISSILQFLGNVGRFLQIVSIIAEQSGIMSTAVTVIGEVISHVINILKTFAGVLVGGIIVGIQTFVTWMQKAVTVVSSFVKGAGAKLGSVGKKVSTVFSKVTNIFKGFNKQNKAGSTAAKNLQSNLSGASSSMKKLGMVTKDTGFQVAKQQTLWSKFLDALNKVKNVALTVVVVIGGAIATLGKNIFSFFTDFGARFKTVTANAKTIGDFIKGLFVTIGSLFADGWEKVKDFFSQFDIDLSNLSKAFSTIKDGLTMIIDKLGPGRIAAFAFATAMLALVGSVIKLSDSFRSMFGAVTGVFNNINKILKKQFAKSSVITDLAKAFAIIAASLTLLTFVDKDDLEAVSKIMLKLMVTFTLCALALRGLDLLLSKFDINTDFNMINSNILALAGSMTLLAGAFAILNMMDLKKDWLKRLGIMAIMFAEVTAAAVLISRFAPQLSKGSILLLSLALSMKIMVDALTKIGENDIDGVNKNIAGFSVLFLGVAAMTAAAGKIKLTSALSLILVAKALKVLIPEIGNMVNVIAPYINEISSKLSTMTIDVDKAKQSVKAFFDKINSFFAYLYDRFNETTATILSVTTIIGGVLTACAGLAAIVGAGFAIAAVIFAIGTIGDLLKGVGIAMIGFAVALRIATSSIIELGNYFNTLTEEQVNRVLIGIGMIGVAITACIGLITMLDGLASQMSQNKGALSDGKTIRTGFFGIAAAIVSLGAAMYIIVKAMDKMQYLDPEKLKPLTVSMAAILVALGIAAAGAGQIQRGTSVVVGLIGVCVAIALLIAEIGIISTMWTPENETGMKVGLAVVFGFLGAIATIIALAIGLKGGKGALSVLLPIFGMMLTIGGVLITLTAMNAQWPIIVSTLGGFALIMGMLAVLIRVISKSQGLNNPKKLIGIGAVVISLLGVAVSIGLLAKAIDAFGFLEVGVALGVMLVSIYALHRFMKAIINMPDLSWKNMIPKLALIGTVVTSLVIFASSLAILTEISKKYGIGHSITAIASLSIGMYALYRFVKAINGMDKITWKQLLPKLALLGGIVVAIVGLAVSLRMLSTIDVPVRVWSSLGALTLGMVLITGLTAVFAAMGKLMNWKQLLSTIGLVASMMGLVYILTSSLCKLSEIDTDKLTSARKNLDTVLGVILAVSSVLGLLQVALVAIGSIFGSAIGAWAGAVAIPLVILSIGTSIAAAGAGLYIGAKAISVLTDSLTKLVPVLRELGQLPLKEIVTNLEGLAGPLASLGVALVIFGAGAGIGGVGIYVLAAALEKLNPYLEDFATGLKELQQVDIGSITSDLIGLSIAGFTLGSSAGGVGSFAAAIGGLASSLNAYNKASGKGGVPLGSTLHGSGKGGKSGSFGYSNTVANECSEAEEIMETHTVTMQKGYADNVQIVEQGTLYNTEAYANKVSETVNIADEEVAKSSSSIAANSKKASTLWEINTKESAENIKTTVSESGKEAGKSWSDNLTSTAIANAKKKDTETAKAMVGAATAPFKGAIDEAAGTITQGINDIAKSVKTGDVWGQVGKLIGVDLSKGAIGTVNSMLWNYLNGMAVKFSSTLAQYGANGMPSNVMNTMTGGVMSSQYRTLHAVASKVSETNDSLDANDFILGKLKDTIGDLVPSLDDATGSLGEFADAEGKAGKGAKELAKDLKSTIANQLDIFSKFEIKTGITGKQMIENMKSNIDGFASWSHRMAVLAQRFAEAGIDKGLYQKLAEMGPKGYETMNAFYEMSAEELAQVKDLYATSLTLPDSQANIVGAGYEYMGEMAVKGFSNALDDHMAAHEAIHGFTKDVIDTGKEDLGIHSPSTVFWTQGYFCVMGFAKGIMEKYTLATGAIEYLAKMIHSKAANEFKSDNFVSYGSNVSEGIAKGIKDNSDSVFKALKALGKDGQDEYAEVNKIESPSKVFASFGRYMALGVAVGLLDAAKNVEEAAAYVASSAIDSYQSAIDTVQNYTDLNTTLLLTPVLDMGQLDSQLSGISKTIGVKGQNGGTFSTETTPSQQINFTQNNYSPKALSRIDIYRQTKNQVSMLKGATANA